MNRLLTCSVLWTHWTLWRLHAGGGGEEGEGGRGVGGEVHDWEGFEERLVHRVITSRGAKPCRLL